MSAEVFAVEDHAAQICFPHLEPGDWSVEVAGQTADVAVEAPGPVAVSVDQLPAGTSFDVCLSGPSVGNRLVGRGRTLEAAPGRLLGRFATVSDIHLGSFAFGLRNTIREHRHPGNEPFPWRCAHAAISEAVAWGAEAIIVKGDLTATAKRPQLEAAGRLLAGVPVPVHVLLGNHEMTRRGPDPWEVLAGYGIDAVRDVRAVEMDGLRVVLAHTPAPVTGRGRLHPPVRDRAIEATQSARTGVLVVLHHYLQAYPFPTFYPVSIPGHVANRFLRRLRDANPNTLVTTGHSHRNRRHHRQGVTVTEVASTLHYPGVWAGYAVHEGGLRQVVHRIAEPSAMAWLEQTKRAAGGVWGWWAPGRLDDRCFWLPWEPATRKLATG